ncbi:MAG: lysophospholipid acyltransferase family protein [Planctomycetota bacterium]
MTDPSQPSTRAKEARQKSGREVSVYLRRAFYRLMRIVARVIFVLWFRIRVEGRHHVPLDGGGMLLSTHQSGIDPILVGLSCNRNLNYLARSTLFKNPVFSFLIRILDAIEIDRERGGLSGLREMLSRLRSGELVLLFPEGTRTPDGSIGALKPGFLPIAKRSEVPLIPVAIVVAFECMPNVSRWLFPRPIAVVFGKPLLAQEYLHLSEQQIIESISGSLSQLYDRGKNHIERNF